MNQSIALITNQRRSRIVAAREFRLIKAENDALRQELNDWRSRNALPRVEEPPRSADHLAFLAVEEEAEGEEMTNMMINSRRAAFEMGEDDDYNDDGDDEQQLSPESAHPYNAGATAITIPTIGHKVLPVPVHHQHQQHQQAAQYAAAAAQQQAAFEQQKAAMARAQMAARATYVPQQQMYSTENFFAAGDIYAPEYTGSAQSWTQKAAGSLATPPSSSHGHGMKNDPSPYANTVNAAFLSSSPYSSHYPPQGGLGVVKPTGGRARSEDGDSVGESAGSSHFSSVSDLSATLSNGMVIGGSPVDHAFSFNVEMVNGMPMPMNMGMGMMPMMGHGMGNLGGAMGIPSPPHSVSPSGSQPQSRRPSVNIPACYSGGGNGSKHASPNLSPDPTPTPAQTQFAGMGLMM